MSSRATPTVPNPYDEILSFTFTKIRGFLASENDSLAELTLHSPPPHVKADYSFSTFFLRRDRNQDATKVASRVAQHLGDGKHRLIKRIFAVGPYVNIEVNQELFSKQVLTHIQKEADRFGLPRSERREHMSIECVSSIPTAPLASDEVRMLIVANVLRTWHELAGKTVALSYYLDSSASINHRHREEVEKMMKRSLVRYKHCDEERDANNVVAEALKQGVAEYISGTEAVITTPMAQLSPEILQKNDASPTRTAKHIAHIRTIAGQKELTSIIYMYSDRDANVMATILGNARRLDYLFTGLRFSAVGVGVMPKNIPVATSEDELRYLILGTPLHQTLTWPEGFNPKLDQIRRLISGLQTNSTAVTNGAPFDLLKLLALFPTVVERAYRVNEPAFIPEYLDNIVMYLKTLEANPDEDARDATRIVLQNGLRLLTL